MPYDDTSVPGNGQQYDQHEWNSDLYARSFSFIWEHGQSLVELLGPKKGERVLDLGSGTGQLTQLISQAGAAVTGLEQSPKMLAYARASYPRLRFVFGDAANFAVEQPFDAVFSNATIHWVQDQEGLLACVANALRPGGRFVAELGGRGNVQWIVDALNEALTEAGYPAGPDVNPWYFPSVGEYTALLEQFGLYPTYAALFARPTPLDGGGAGLRIWLKMFADRFFEGIPDSERERIYRRVERRLRPILSLEGAWSADYYRLRFVAYRQDPAKHRPLHQPTAIQ